MKKEYKNPFIVMTTIETAGMIAASVDGFEQSLDNTEIEAGDMLGRENDLWGNNDATDDAGIPSFNVWED
jgi:hypothetical protein